MRIRKRQASFSLSDPHSSSMVQLHSAHHQPFDQTQAHGCKGLSSVGEEQKDGLVSVMHGGCEEAEKEGNHAREGIISTLVGTHQESHDSLYLAPTWFRRGDSAITYEKDQDAKMNKEWAEVKPSEDNNAQDNIVVTKQNSNVEGGGLGGGGRKRGRGGAIMEGSRCSRVNGRGWRCCQPTLVGYSLCEHHLGKGRLRSMNTVGRKSIGGSTSSITAPKNKGSEAEKLSSLLKEKKPKYKDGSANEDGEEKALVVTKKRMKLGMVKARSISSLLGQTNTASVEQGDN